MMRNHLVSCLESGIIKSFPKYRVELSKKAPITPVKQSDLDWELPRRSQRLKKMQDESKKTTEIKTSNRFVIPPMVKN